MGSLDEGPERVKGLLESGIGEKSAGKLGGGGGMCEAGLKQLIMRPLRVCPHESLAEGPWRRDAWREELGVGKGHLHKY